MSGQLMIEGRLIDEESDCYVIAEVGRLRQGKVDKAKKLLAEAKEAGASAVQMEFSTEGFQALVEYARELGLALFASAFDFESADRLARLDMPAYPIASADLCNTPLLKYVARIGKPMIVSTGGALLEDVWRAYDTIVTLNPQLCILQCTTACPVSWNEIDLKVIETYRNDFPDAVVGLSSREEGSALSLAAFALGARVLVKPFALNRARKEMDWDFALDAAGMSNLVRDLLRVRLAWGDGRKKVHPSEVDSIAKNGKSIVAACDLPAGHALTAADLALKCPGGGLPPYQIEHLLGQVTVRPLRADEALCFEDVAETMCAAA